MNTEIKPSFTTLEAALAEYQKKGKVEAAYCERCASVIEVTSKTEAVLVVSCKCGLYNDTLRGL